MNAFRPVGRRMFWSCHVCGCPAVATTERAVQAAVDAHATYVNLTKDRASDEHFAEIRIDRLLAD